MHKLKYSSPHQRGRFHRDRVTSRQLATINRQLQSSLDVLSSELANLRTEHDRWQIGWPPGHFYSPIPALDEIRASEERIFRWPGQLPGIELNELGQLQLVEQLSAFYHQQPFAAQRQEGLRYFFENPNYSYGDAIVLYCMLRHLRPKRVIEIGSGYSSCVTLDTNELFLDNSVQCTFIEPDPDLLLSLAKPAERNRLDIIGRNLQDIDLGLFATLEAGDILFIDSTHVAKINSDVNYIFFEILPKLQKGVYIHIHDIFYPFEYPREWIYQGRAWNEAYVLRAFLEYNDVFEIQLYNSFLGFKHREALAQAMPLCACSPGAGIWLKKVFATPY
jgi:hypothetical protein